MEGVPFLGSLIQKVTADIDVWGLTPIDWVDVLMVDGLMGERKSVMPASIFAVKFKTVDEIHKRGPFMKKYTQSVKV